MSNSIKTPLVGASYDWNFGGTKPERVTVLEVREEPFRKMIHRDGSESPGGVRLSVRISEFAWVNWYDGREFELVGADNAAQLKEKA